jgi:hypothetical protein
MLALLNMLTLLLACVTSIVAIFGDTVAEGSEPLLKRITGRGWFSIVLFVLMLIVGAAKERLDGLQKHADKIAADKRELDLREERDKLETDLQALKKCLDSTDKGSENRDVITHERLDKLLAMLPPVTGGVHVISDSASSSPELTEIVDKISIVAVAQLPVGPANHSQETQIQGTVSNVKGDPVENVDIRVMDEEGRIIGAVRSGQGGQYLVRVFSSDGPLSVVYSHPGNHATLARGLAANQNHELDVTLRHRPARIIGGGIL